MIITMIKAYVNPSVRLQTLCYPSLMKLTPEEATMLEEVRPIIKNLISYIIEEEIKKYLKSLEPNNQDIDLLV